ncbi:MAG: glycosyltransferase, partial [Deltaproteobacteria bacterium]|nr:glycosyltransferase [Deltaproteobacteria bacterium]
MSRLRLQFIIGQLTYGGSERHLVDTVLHLDWQRFKVQVVCLRPGGPLAAPLKEAGVDYLEIPVIGGCGLPGWRLYRAIRRFDPRIVYTFTFVDKLWGRLAAALAKTPVIITSFRNSTTAYYEPWLCRLSTAVVCNSENLQTFYRRRYNIPPEKVLYLPNGIDLASRQPQSRAEARKRLGVDPEALLAAQVARLHPNKDHPTSLAAFKLVGKRLPQARLMLIGHGDPAKARRMISGLGLEESVYLLKTTPRMEDVYNAADLVMLSSRHEGVPRAMVEAAAHARPLLATTVGG